MRRTATLPSPNFFNPEDEQLKFFGSPDLILLVEGRKLYVHSIKLKTYSDRMAKELQRPDPMLGKMIQMQGRTIKGVLALLNAIYPPQKVPPPDTFDEVNTIANDYNMVLLKEKMKVGIMKNCSIEPLKVAEDKKLEVLPPVVVDAFAEFRLEELKGMEGYSDLQAGTKLAVARKRIEVLEQEMEKAAQKDAKRSHGFLFRSCPEEELAQEDGEDQLGLSKLNDNGRLMESSMGGWDTRSVGSMMS